MLHWIEAAPGCFGDGGCGLYWVSCHHNYHDDYYDVIPCDTINRSGCVISPQLASIPVKSRSIKVTLALAKLYHYFKKDRYVILGMIPSSSSPYTHTHIPPSPTAMVYYRMVLM